MDCRCFYCREVRKSCGREDEAQVEQMTRTTGWVDSDIRIHKERSQVRVRVRVRGGVVAGRVLVERKGMGMGKGDRDRDGARGNGKVELRPAAKRR